MDLESFRRSKALTLEQLANELGLRSKGYLSRIERKETAAPIKLALQIETYSEGKVPAEDLVSPADAELLRAFRRRQARPAIADAHA